MFKLRTHRTIISVRRAWKKLISTGCDTRSVYQSYWVNAAVKRRMPIYGFQEKYSVRYLELLEDGQTQMILPVCKYRGTDRYCSVGKFNGFQVYDFIYSREMTADKMRQCLSFVLQQLNVHKLSLLNVPHDSVLYSCLTETEAPVEGYQVTWGSNDNVCIDTDLNYESWHSKLSKSTRQNLRTAYNRMNTDGVSVEFEIKRAEKIKGKMLNEMIKLYCKRHSERYNVETSALKKLYLRYLDFSTACLRSYPDNFYAAVYMNGQLAAFMSGLVEKEGSSAIIPRLSIEDAFSKYSPGMVLINETVRSMSSDLGIRFLDLSKGAEKYKFSMGGQLHNTHNIEITQTEDL